MHGGRLEVEGQEKPEVLGASQGGAVVEVDAREEALSELGERLRRAPSRTAMLAGLGRLSLWLASFLFSRVQFEERGLQVLRGAAARGPLVYVMRVESRLDYLYFNWAFVKKDLPLARMSNGQVTRYFWGVGERLASLLRWRPRAPEEEQFEALVRDRAATFLFLERSRGTEVDQIEYSQKYLYRLVRAQKEMEESVQVVGLTLLWERRPEPRGASLVGEVFGTARSPGLVRKVFGVVPTLWRSFFNLGEPLVRVSAEVDLRGFMSEYPNAGSADASELLRERLLGGIERERRLILGPTGKKTSEMSEAVVRSPEVEATMERMAQEGADPKELRAKARAFFDEIAAYQSLFMLKLFSVVLGIVWYWIYDGLEVDEEGLERVKEEGRDKSLILVPSHKSHVDYLIISYIFYHYGLMPPHIAAGVNLSFFPIGPLFRRAGAFFIRRSFKGEELYPVVFEEYLVELMRQRYPIEFFIEGTRSRTGKLVKPRYGMLEMIARAVAKGRVEGVSVIPISVGYETIVESGSYTREVRGEEKKKEGLGELLKAPRFLASRYGRLNVQFGEPIDLEEYLQGYGFEPQETGKQEDLDALTVRLGHRINYEINAATAVTPTALAAAVLLNAEGRRINRARMIGEVGFVLKFLRQPERHARLTRTLEAALGEELGVRGALEVAIEGEAPLRREAPGPLDSEERMGRAVASALDEALELFEEKDHVSRIEEEGAVYYQVPDEGRSHLSFYRNNIIHLFVPESLLATAALKFGSSEVEYEELREETRFLSGLFKYEWIYEESARFESVFERTLQYFERMGWVERVGSKVVLVGTRRDELRFLRRVTLAFVEAYARVASELEAVSAKPTARGEVIARALKSARADFLGGTLSLAETVSKPTFLNAWRLLADWGVIEVREEGKKSDLVVWGVAPEWEDRREELTEHLMALTYLGEQPGKSLSLE